MRISTRTKRRLTPLAGAAAVGLLLFAFCLCFSATLESPDCGWILRTGLYILARQTLPEHDLYSWTCQSHHWVVYQWLFEVLSAAVLQRGGLSLVGLTTYMTAAVMLLFIMPLQWLKRCVPVWITYVALLFTLNTVWFQMRPQLASFLFIGLWLAILERHRLRLNQQRSLIWMLPPLMVLWANLHSFWFIGLLEVLLYALCSKRNGKDLWIVFCVSAAAVLINPYGPQLIAYNLSFINSADRGIAELRSPFLIDDWGCRAFLVYVTFSSVMLISKARKLPRAGLLFAAIATGAALLMARFMPVAILATWPYLGMALSNDRLGGSGERSFDLSLRYKFTALTLLIVAVALPSVIWRRAVPTETAAANLFTADQLDGLRLIAKMNVFRERLYNDERLGSRLLFFGITPVFIDNRFDVYGPQFCQDWFVAHYADPGWQQYLKRFGVTAIALSQGEPLFKALLADPSWILVYDDGYMSYWLSETVEHRNQLVRLNMSPARISDSLSKDALNHTLKSQYAKYRATGLACLDSKNYEAALNQFQQALEIAPQSADAHHWLIHAYAVSGDRQRLIAELIKARPFFWRFDGEKVAANDQQGQKGQKGQFTLEQEKRIRDWAEDSAKQLLQKYSTGH